MYLALTRAICEAVFGRKQIYICDLLVPCFVCFVVYAYVMNCCLACSPAQHPASAASVTGYPSKQAGGHSCSAVRVAVLTKELQAFLLLASICTSFHQSGLCIVKEMLCKVAKPLI